MGFAASGITAGLKFILGVEDEDFSPKVQGAINQVGALTTAIFGATAAIKLMNIAVTTTLNLIPKLTSVWGDYEEALNRVRNTTERLGRDPGTANQLRDQAAFLERYTRFSDEATLSAARFFTVQRNISESKFNQVMRLSADFAEQFGQSISTSSDVISRALEHPVEGIEAIRRRGVILDTQLKENVRTLVEMGMESEAALLVIDSLEQKIGGAAVDASETWNVQLQQLNNQLRSLATVGGQVIATFLQPYIKDMNQVLDFTHEASRVFEQWEKVLTRKDIKQLRRESGVIDWMLLQTEIVQRPAQTGIMGLFEGPVRSMIGMSDLDAELERAAALDKEISEVRPKLLKRIAEEAKFKEKVAEEEEEWAKNLARLQEDLAKSEEREQKKKSREAARQFAEEERKTQALMTRARILIQSTETAEEEAGRRMLELNDLRKEGLLTQEQYARLTESIKKDFLEGTEAAKKLEAAEDAVTKKMNELKKVNEKIRKLDEKAAEQDPFVSRVESLTGLTSRIQSSLMSDPKKDPQERTRKELEDTKVKLEKQLVRLNETVDKQLTFWERMKSFAGTIVGGP